MPPLTATHLLAAWELALSQSLPQRALTFLALVHPGTPAEQLNTFPVGRRDAHLLDLREMLFGSQMSAQAACPACAQELELTFPVCSIRVASPPEAAASSIFRRDDYHVEFRLPNSEDLAAVVPAENRAANVRRLLQRCVLNARCKGETITIDSLPAELMTAISDCMGEADPQADVQLALTCPDCGHRWQSPLDIAAYLWTEIHAWATRLLRDIHNLASAYGWREMDILALSPWRRQAYLEMIQR